MKSIQKLLWLLVFSLSVSLYAADWTGASSEPKSTKEIDGKTFYVITSAEELAWFAAQVNSGKTTINAQLANDILFGKDTSSITSMVWTMIGKSSSARFAGVFDGQDYVVYGLYFGNREAEGFFGYVAKEGVVKNLTLVSADASEKKRSGGVVRGGIAAVNYGIIQNCVNKVVRLASVIQGKPGSSYVGYVGGLVGKNYGEITKSQNFANIYLGDLIWPGIAYAAGIAAYNEGTISESYNSGAIYTQVARMNYVGGIASHNASSGKITTSYNSGIVTSFYNITYSRYNPGANNGGIAGLNSGLIENVYNVGKDSSYENIGAVYTGGIVGVNTGASAVVKNAYVAVTHIYAKGSSSYSGGVAGSNNGSAQIINAYYDGSILTGVVAVGQQSATMTDVGSKTTDLMKTDVFVRILNTTDATEVSSGVWGRKGSYPVFVDSSDIYFSIRFFDSDTTLLDSQYVQYGRTPSYASTPTKVSTAQYSYAFEGWHVEPTAATEDFDYYAVYSETLRSYTVRFLDFDGSELQSSSFLYGATPGISKVPARASTVAYDYAFSGWTPAIDTVKGPATYTAIFDSTEIPQGGSSSSSEASSSSGEKSSSSAVSSGSSAKSSSSSAGKNSSSSSEPSDALVANLPSPAWSVTAAGRNFQVHAAPVGKSYALFDLQGKVLAKGRIENSEMTISAPRAGSYIVRIGNSSVRMNAK